MIHICALTGNEHTEFHYLIADRLVSSNFFFQSLSDCHPYVPTVKTPVEDRRSFVFAPSDQIAEAATIYCGLGWLGNEWREATLKPIEHGYWLNVAEIGDFYVAADGSVIYVQSQLPPNNEWLIETIVGPALTLALALQGIFCLHASAVVMNGQVMAFVGESGWGKSTLTAFLNHELGSKWQFVADDVLPICFDKQGVVCLPHFPQLKIPVDQQWGTECSRKLPLSAVYLINQPDQNDTSIQIQPLTPLEATLALLRHTVAAKLFDNQLLARHLAFFADIVDQVAIKRLVYPRVYAELPAVSIALAIDADR